MTDADFDTLRLAAEDAKNKMLAARAAFDDALLVQERAQHAYYDAKAMWHRREEAFQGEMLRRQRASKQLSGAAV